MRRWKGGSLRRLLAGIGYDAPRVLRSDVSCPVDDVEGTACQAVATSKAFLPNSEVDEPFVAERKTAFLPKKPQVQDSYTIPQCPLWIEISFFIFFFFLRKKQHRSTWGPRSFKQGRWRPGGPS